MPCKTCRYYNPSKNHLNQGLCDKINSVGSVLVYDTGMVTLPIDIKVGILSDGGRSKLLVSQDFGCPLFESKSNEDNTNKSAEVSSTLSVESKVSGSVEHHK